MLNFTLRFPEHEIPHLAAAYSYPGEPELIAGPAAAAKTRGALTHADLVAFGEWKSPRNRARYAANPPAFVEEVTGLALAASTSPRLSIEALTLLSGVEWPTASVILHFCHRESYPILDFRALWSLSMEVPKRYDFPFWLEYTDFTRALSARTGHSMRVVDRALWQYSSQHQPAA